MAGKLSVVVVYKKWRENYTWSLFTKTGRKRPRVCCLFEMAGKVVDRWWKNILFKIKQATET
jgi:hypothetical protein